MINKIRGQTGESPILQFKNREFTRLTPEFYSGAKASRTLPGICPRKPYPEFTKSIPPAVVGPGPLMAPPCPDTPLTVVNSRAVSKSQITRPSAVECARKCPSRDPEKTTPGMTVTAADCAGLQP